MRITNCKVNHLTAPLGYWMEKPVFSWQVEEAEGKAQTKARLVVRQGGETVADTGFAQLDSLAEPVEMELAPRTRYTWTVTVCTHAGEEAVSDENWFETGKENEGWNAKWIGDSQARHPMYSKRIAPAKPVKSARLYICGLGLYEAYYVPGKDAAAAGSIETLRAEAKIGEELLAPYCNNYNEWVQYQTYDVTEKLKEEGNLCVLLGNGWYFGRFGFNDPDGRPYYGKGRKLLAELRLTYEDGTEEAIGTDESWQVDYSNIFFSNIYDGEQMDDTLEPVAAAAAQAVEPPKGALTARRSLPVKALQELPAAELIHTPAGETVVDLGQNIAGSFRLRIHEPKGTKIHVQVGEVLQQGNFYRDNLRSAKAEYIYISDGQEHVLQPYFTFYGYRYAKVEGVTDLKPEDFTGLAMYSDLPRNGWLETGNEMVNRLVLNTEWGQKGNFVDVPTDCPQRDERMGWTGDAEVFSPTACYQMDSYAFFAKYLYDMATEQKTRDGAVPDVIPSFGHKGIACAWGDAACVIPWVVYRFYGDKSILEGQFDSMKGWVDHIYGLEQNDQGWRKHFHYGDWLALDGPGGIDGVMGATENAFIALVYLRYSAQLTAKAAAVLGKAEEERYYSELADKMLKEIRHEYFAPSGRCCLDTQTALLLSLRHGLTVDREQTAKRLQKKFDDNDGKLQTGFVGTPILGEELTKAGLNELAYGLLFNEEYPGWLYEVKLGATTIWERWNSMLEDGSVSSTGMNSFNHYSYGSIVEWMYAYVAGIRQAEDSIGFRHVCISPVVDARLGHVDARYQSAMGLWKTSWKAVDDNHLEFRVTVPFGCQADVTLPYAPESLYGDKENAIFAHVEDGVCRLEAGSYSVTYETTAPLRRIYSTATPLKELLGVPAIRSFLTEKIPQIGQVPDHMKSSSIRELAAHFAGHLEAGTLEVLDEALAKLG